MRDMVFVSHANPEDNEFALWLALQVANEGYPVWCDLTKLLGGEVFWDDIEEGIRQRTVKFLYVLSTASNYKAGSRSELTLALRVKRAEKLKDFVIPLWIDSLSPADFNVEITRITAIPFAEGWAQGLSKLIEKLEKDGVGKKAAFGPTAVSSWWREHANASAGLKTEPEPLITNWYPLEPTTLYFHELEPMDGIDTLAVMTELPYPAVPFNQYLVSFAPAEDFDGNLGSDLRIRESITRTINPYSDPHRGPRLWSFRQERTTLSNLLRLAWERIFVERGLAFHAFANGAKGCYFTKGQVPEDRIEFIGSDGVRSRRDVVGYKTLKGVGGASKGRRYWHFCLEAKPTSHPMVGYTMRPHVLFSDDGQIIWNNTERMHKARRAQCKMWWNDKWRDLIAATVSWLAAEEPAITISVGSSTILRVAARPIRLESPVSYDEPLTTAPEEVGEAEEISESDLEDDYDEADDETGSGGKDMAAAVDGDSGEVD